MVTNKQTSKLTGWVAVMILCTPLIACSTVSENSHIVTAKPLRDKNEMSFKGARDATFSAALSPLEDIGLRKRDIPELLEQLAQNPYFPPAKPYKCDAIKQEMADLDTLLGDDDKKEEVALSANAQYAMAGAEMVQDAVVNLVKSQVNVIPFRSIVRRITGANKHEKHVAQAVQGGNLRRAYLRGLAQAEFGDACLPSPRMVTAQTDTKDQTAIQRLSAHLDIAAK